MKRPIGRPDGGSDVSAALDAMNADQLRAFVRDSLAALDDGHGDSFRTRCSNG
jgi:hypothetical protein